MLTSKPLRLLYNNMTKHIYTIVIAILFLACIAVVLFHLVTLTKFPIVFIDEPWYSNVAWNWLKEGVNFDSMHAESRPNAIWPYIGNLPLRISFDVFGLGLFQARLVSWIFGILLLILTALVGLKSYGIASGVLAALLLSLSTPFLQSSHLVRPDIILSTMGVLCYFLTLIAFLENRRWAHLLSGLLISLSLDIHWNAIILGVGLFVLYIYHYRAQVLKSSDTWLFILGVSLGLIYYLIVVVMPDPSKFVSFYRFSSEISHPMPLFSFNLMELLRSVREEIRRYGFYQNSVDFIFIFAGMVYLIFRRSKADRLLLIFIATVFLGFVLLTGNKSFEYAIILYPFFILVAAEAIRSLYHAVAGVISSRALVVAILILLVFSGGLRLARTISGQKDYDYNATVEMMKSVIPNGSRVLGIPVWWLGFNDYDFQSLESLSFFHYINGYSLTEGLEAIKPDYDIFDEDVGLRLVDDNYFGKSVHEMYKIPGKEFMKFLNLRGTNVLEFSDPGHGNIVIYQIHWD